MDTYLEEKKMSIWQYLASMSHVGVKPGSTNHNIHCQKTAMVYNYYRIEYDVEIT